jgi:CYTH domain-containing protein
MKQEIERKWLVKPIPTQALGPGTKIIQTYINKVRIRTESYNWNDGVVYMKAFATMKSSKGLVRNEVEDNIPCWLGEQLTKNTKTIEKTRYTLAGSDNRDLTVDEFKGSLAGLWIMEKEFESVKQAREYKVDAFLQSFVLKEVTDDPRYTNYSLFAADEIPTEI